MKNLIIILVCVCIGHVGFAQGMHFSQYNHAPMLLNPANTGLLQDNDWRLGVNYRNQSATIPVPYNTFSVFSDFGLFRNKWETSWLGGGVAMWRDVAGNGNLALTKVQGNLAYHVLTSENSSLSAGLGMSYNQRSVDFSKLTFDVQWDEFSFNKGMSNFESNTTQKTTFLDMTAGANFSFYNNNNLYVKIGLGAQHINQPVESFYGESNKMGMRPIGNVDVVFKASDKIMINPSLYYTKQKKASELVGGSMFHINTTGTDLSMTSNEVMLGVFYRNKDAVIAVAGYKFKNHRVTFSYDHTISQLSEGNGGVGAFELSLILQGNFRNPDELRNTYGCPRF